MRYALVNGEMSEAQRGLSGECRGCGKPMLARCGAVRINHWSHKGELTCDPWLKDKTEWHIKWQDHFPKPWQEFRLVAECGELHIADVKTIKDWVIEFQHSPLAPEERKARNDFYKKLVWVVDGMRRKRDKEKFFECLREVASVSNQQSPIRKIFKVAGDDCALLRDWSDNSSPVFFDFGIEDQMLWCLLPKSADGECYVLEFWRQGFLVFHQNELLEKDFFADLMRNIIAQIGELNARPRVQQVVQVIHRPLPRYSRPQYGFRKRRRF